FRFYQELIVPPITPIAQPSSPEELSPTEELNLTEASPLTESSSIEKWDPIEEFDLTAALALEELTIAPGLPSELPKQEACEPNSSQQRRIRHFKQKPTDLVLSQLIQSTKLEDPIESTPTLPLMARGAYPSLPSTPSSDLKARGIFKIILQH